MRFEPQKSVRSWFPVFSEPMKVRVPVSGSTGANRIMEKTPGYEKPFLKSRGLLSANQTAEVR